MFRPAITFTHQSSTLFTSDNLSFIHKAKQEQVDNANILKGNRSKGSIAQLVERRLCKADVSGSSPLTSTSFTIYLW